VGHPTVKLSSLELDAEEIRVMREEAGVQMGLDGGEINTIVFRTWVVTHDCETKQGKQQYGQKTCWRFVSLQNG
jgi:hypothetical protein